MTLRLRAGHFYGGAARTQEVTGFRLTERIYRPGLNPPPHGHELAHFCYVLAGRYRERLGRRSEERAASTLVWYPPDVTHAEKHYETGRQLLIEISQPQVKDWGITLSGPASSLSDSSKWLARRLYAEFREPDEFSRLAMEGILLELVAATCRSNGKIERTPPRWLATVAEILQTNYAAPPSLASLAATAGVHPIHLARTFRRWRKSSISDYVRQLRIDKAAALMTKSDRPLVQIALEVGFADQSHFVKSFRRATGMTPAKFRSLAKD